MKKLFVILMFMSPQPIFDDPRGPLLVVWNVGQGQWVSLVEHDRCVHFDIGGEKLPPVAKLYSYCRKKLNLAVFSHWDWDHIGLARKAQARLPDLCLALPPKGSPTPRKKGFLQRIQACELKGRQNFKELRFKNVSEDSNAQSRVFQIYDRILNPGDSGIEQERLWAPKVKNAYSTKLLILGHHGSRTSTGGQLLNSLRQLRQAAISARYRRYKHPHWSVEAKLRAYGISPIRTEDWGNLIFPLHP